MPQHVKLASCAATYGNEEEVRRVWAAGLGRRRQKQLL